MYASQLPLADCTSTTLSQQNVQRSRKQKEQSPTINTTATNNGQAKTFSHNPYAASVVPESVGEMMRVFEQRRLQAERRAMSSPNLMMLMHQQQFGNATGSPMMARAHSQQQFFFDEPEVVSQPSTPANVSMASAPEFHPAPKKNQQPQAPVRETPVEAAPAPAPTTPVKREPEEPRVRSPTSSTAVLTKVYQNGRPVPRVRSEEVVEDPTIVATANSSVTVAVKFQLTTSNYTMTDMSVRPGAHVVVDGDRGIDLGVVVGAVEVDKKDIAGNIQRLAEESEIERLTTLRQDEEKALDYVRHQASRHLNQNITVERVTFQFDKNKLTVWYRTSERVYFVPLLKALNQQYKCRIWMERLDEATEGQ